MCLLAFLPQRVLFNVVAVPALRSSFGYLLAVPSLRLLAVLRPS